MASPTATSQRILSQFSCFVFDLDGTIWKGDTLIPGAKATIDFLKGQGKKLLYVTNNSSKSRANYVDKLSSLDISAQPDEVYSSSYAAAAFLRNSSFSKKVYVVGGQGIKDELGALGIPSLGGPDDDARVADWKQTVDQDPEVGAVVCGVDKGLNYYKIHYASLCLLHNPDCLFVATNTDARGHFNAHQEGPGAGATLGAIQGTTEMKPVVTGKPTPFILEEIMRYHGVQKDHMCIVGDRLDTDIQWGMENGIATCLVMTGVTSKQRLNQEKHIRPDFVLESVAELKV